jgi:hypothetical protein
VAGAKFVIFRPPISGRMRSGCQCGNRPSSANNITTPLSISRHGTNTTSATISQGRHGIRFLDLCDRSLCSCRYFCSTPSTPMAWKSASLRTSARISHGSILAFQSLSIASLLGYWKIRTRLATLSASMAMALL